MKLLRVVLFFLCIVASLALIFFSLFFVQAPQLQRQEDVTRTQEGIQEEIARTIPVVLFVLEQKYELHVPPDSTVYEVMDIARKTSDLRFRGKDFGGLGFFVEEINGVSQDPLRQMYWVYSINGIKSQAGVSSYTLSAGDIISWTYEQSY